MLKVLIAEDDLIIADYLEETLVDAGYDVCGIARTVSEGVALARLHKPDLAVLDVRLARGGAGREIAAALRAGGRTGILYATGNPEGAGLTVADGDACITKPYSGEALLAGLKLVREIIETGAPLAAFPRGFQAFARDRGEHHLP
ncbi:MAG: response regulator [Pseudomonadota bacterium]|nr:response regulator [Pseudomonadota bacterium]